MHLGIDPYRHAPAALAHAGQAHVLGAVDPFWRHTTAPYGPLFLWIVSGIVALTGSHLIAGVLLLRVLDVAGLVLLAVFAPRLARALGADPARATWWVLLSPLILLELVAAAHNDLLMIGLLVAGVTFAIERRLLVGIALCALAATIKLPAAAAIPFILVGCADRRTWWRGVLVAAAVVARGERDLRSRARVDLDDRVLDARTRCGSRSRRRPRSAGRWRRSCRSGRGVSSRRSASSRSGSASCSARCCCGARAAGTWCATWAIALIAVAVCGPAAWPWYLTWGLVLLAACPGIQQSRALALAVVASVLVVKADGILALPAPHRAGVRRSCTSRRPRCGCRGRGVVASGYRRPAARLGALAES